MCLLMWDLLTDPNLLKNMHIMLCFIRYFFSTTLVYRPCISAVVMLRIVHHMSRLYWHVGHSAESLCCGLAGVLAHLSSSYSFCLFIFFQVLLRLHLLLVLTSHHIIRERAMNQKAVLITGCSSGIGLALAVCLAKDEKKRFMGKVHRISIVV